MNVGHKFVNGLKWNSVGRLYRTGFNAGVFFLLAKLLSPTEIGLIGMAMVFVSFFNLILNMGFESTIIKGKELSRVELSKLWLVNIVLGVFLFLSGIIGSYFIGLFYNNDEVGKIFSYLSVIFLLTSFSIVQRGLLMRQMRFKEVTIVEIVSASVAGVAAISLAFLNFNYFSIIVQQVLLALLNTIGFLIISKWRPKVDGIFRNWKIVTAPIKYSINVLFFNATNFATQKVDVLIIGKLLGEYQLGLYMLAVNIVVVPYSQIAQIFSRTIFPILSKYYNDIQVFKVLYLRLSVGLFVALAPFAAFFAFINEGIIDLFFGSAWSGIVVLIPIFCFQITRNSIVSPIGLLFLSLNRPDFQWKNSILFVFPMRIIGIFIGFYFFEKSAFGIALGFNITATIAIIPGMMLAFKLSDIKLVEFLDTYREPFFASLGIVATGVVLYFTQTTYLIKLTFLLLASAVYFYFIVYKNDKYREVIRKFVLKRN